VPSISEKIQKILAKHNINSFFSGSGSLRDILSNSKDKIPMEEKAGIYEIECGECDMMYIGQTCRRCVERYGEHERAYRKNQPKNSAMAEHCLKENHKIGGFELIKEVQGPRTLDGWESLLINRGMNLVNIGESPILSPLLQMRFD
jgi:hypothetical protein